MLFQCLNMNSARSGTCKPRKHLPATICLPRTSSTGLANSSTGRNILAEGPAFRNFYRVFDQLIELLGRNRGCFDRSPAKTQLPSHRGPLVGSWSISTKALPPSGQILQGELTSCGATAHPQPLLRAVGYCCSAAVVLLRAGGAPAEARHAVTLADVTLPAAQ
jgi:hypothetical protein